MSTTFLTYRFRVKDKHAARLAAQARAVNLVWNYCNETQMKAVRDHRAWLSWVDLINLTSGATKEGLDLHSGCVGQVCRRYDKARRTQKRPWLRWRSKRSLGWIPFGAPHMRLRDGAFWLRGERYDVWMSRPLADGVFGGSFSQDARGRWYLNVLVPAAPTTRERDTVVGIDLGLKSLATLSDGRIIEAPQFLRKQAARIADAQRARKPRLAASRHAKVANQRRDFLHKASTSLVKEFGVIGRGRR